MLLNIDEIQLAFINDELKNIVESLKQDSTQESWHRFFTTLKDKPENEIYRDLYETTAIEILIDQGVAEGKVDITTPLSIIEQNFGATFLRDAIREYLLYYVLDNQSKATKISYLVETLSEDDPNSIQNVTNVEIWKILTGREDVKVFSPYQVGYNLQPSKAPTAIEFPESNKGFLNTVIGIFRKNVCTITYPNGSEVSYKDWEDIDLKKMSLAISITLFTEIPADYFNYPFNIYKFKNLKVLEFFGGKSISNSYNSRIFPQLEEIYIGESVEEIQPHAFSGQKKLKKVTFEQVPEKIDSTVFEGSSLEEIVLLDTEFIQDLTLTNCHYFKSIRTEDGKELTFYSTPAEITSDKYHVEPYLIVFNKKQIKKMVKQRKEGYYIKHQDGTEPEIVYIKKAEEFKKDLGFIYPVIKDDFNTANKLIEEYLSLGDQGLFDSHRLIEYACKITSIYGRETMFDKWEDVTQKDQENARELEVYQNFPFISSSLRCKNWKNLEILVFKRGVTSIVGLSDSFESLRQIVFSETINRVSLGAYRNCLKLEKISFEGNFPEYIDTFAFRNCGIKEIKVGRPDSLAITNLTLRGCENFKRIYTSSGENIPYKRCHCDKDVVIVFNNKSLRELEELFGQVKYEDVQGDSQGFPGGDRGL